MIILDKEQIKDYGRALVKTIEFGKEQSSGTVKLRLNSGKFLYAVLDGIRTSLP